MSEQVKCYTVAIPNLPLFPNKKIKKFIKDISEYEGCIGMVPCRPHGNLILFRTLNNAKSARNRIRTYPNIRCDVGSTIGEVFVDKKYLEEDE